MYIFSLVLLKIFVKCHLDSVCFSTSPFHPISFAVHQSFFDAFYVVCAVELEPCAPKNEMRMLKSVLLIVLS